MATEDPIMATVAGRYASALFELATEQRQVAEVEAELGKFQSLLDESADLRRLVAVTQEMEAPLTVIGNGSNLLIRDGGLRGVVLKIAENMAQIEFSERRGRAQAGAPLAAVSRRAPAARGTEQDFSRYRAGAADAASARPQIRLSTPPSGAPMQNPA